jgi:UDP-N-acetylmuramoyl-tripeptide--D-alanyl-D-alanine ligase
MIPKIYSAFLNCNQKVATDTRKITEGCLFFALKGPNFNGNKFTKEALKKGASYAVIDEEEFSIEGKTFLVEDVLTTLQNLALLHRKQFNIPIIGITGTNGKTTTKELIGAVLSSRYNILITQGNLNNHIGVPLTMLQLGKYHQIAVVEMGASKKGDIKELAEIAMPNYGLITNIGKAHLEGFGDLETIKETKLELYNNIIENNGQIIVNQDDELLMKKIPKNIKKYTYGLINGIVKGKVISFKPTIDIAIVLDNITHQVSTSLLGGYNLMNVLASVCIGKVFEINNSSIISSIENYSPNNNRSQLIKTSKNTVIADCYNANPTSTLQSLISLKSMKDINKIAILGDMLELGDQSEKEHQLIVNYLEENEIKAFLVGDCYLKTKTNFSKFNTTENLSNYLKKKKIYNHIILLKGSRGIQLEKVINQNIL